MKNAFEAAEKTEEKNKGILITLSNSTSSVPVLKDGRYISGKIGDSHGYGIRNVKNWIDKPEGSFEMEYSKEDNTVTVNIFIFNVIPMNDSFEVT